MRRVWGIALASMFACGEPVISEYEPRAGVITGTVLYPAPEARGNVVVALYAESAPPPPRGFGSPINFVVIPEREMFGEDGTTLGTPYAAPFTLPSVPEGRYLIGAFLDADGDFDPTYALLAQASAGDVIGGHVDAAKRPLIVEVARDRVTAQVTVVLGTRLPVERPAFAITSSTSFTVPFSRPQRFALEAHPISRTPLELDPARTFFLLRYADDDADGVADDANGDQLPDLYPRVLLRRIEEAGSTSRVIVPLIIDPLPYVDALTSLDAVTMSTRIELLIPPIAVLESESGRVLLESIPPGEYETIVVAHTGQVWRVPNDLDLRFPGGPDPTQNVRVRMAAGAALEAGRVAGTITANDALAGDVYVAAYRLDDPPPPLGTGRAVAFSAIGRERFAQTDIDHRATFEIAGLPAGAYTLRALVDSDGNFSPLSPHLAEPSSGDRVGVTSEVVNVARDITTRGVLIAIDREITFDRPAFEIEGLSVSRRRLPHAFVLRGREGGVPLLSEEPVSLPVVFGEELLPRVLLSRMSDAGSDPRTTPDDPRKIVIPAVVEPFPLIGQSSAHELRVIIPPHAFVGDTCVSPPPAGRYRVHLLSATGQTWSVPSNIDFALGRAGTPREDPTQAHFIELTEGAGDLGSLSGSITLDAPRTGDFQVVVEVAGKVAIVDGAEFAGGLSAQYRLDGIPPGGHPVLAFIDVDRDFEPWFIATRGPDRGDVGGILPEPVIIAGAEATRDLRLGPGPVYATDRPMFAIAGESTPELTRLISVSETNDQFTQLGTFAIEWIEGGLSPAVVAEDLDDPTRRFIGAIDPQQFAALGFPVVPAIGARVDARALLVSFPEISRGRYRVTVIQTQGQSWSIPNELARASALASAPSQAGVLEIP